MLDNDMTFCEACYEEVHAYTLTDVGIQICPLCRMDFESGLDYVMSKVRGEPYEV